jgi:hypothetical protein
MKNYSISFIVGLVASIALVVYYGYLTFSSMAVASNAPVTVASDLKENMLDDPLVATLKDKNPNGQFPITVNKAEVGKGNPFQ